MFGIDMSGDNNLIVGTERFLYPLNSDLVSSLRAALACRELLDKMKCLNRRLTLKRCCIEISV